MSVTTDAERARLQAIADLACCNPFLETRIDCERAVLGDDHLRSNAVWSLESESTAAEANLVAIGERAQALVETVRARLHAGQKASRQERQLYQEASLYLLYHSHRHELLDLITDYAERGKSDRTASFYRRFKQCYEHYFPGDLAPYPCPHVFAICFQLRRAFHYIFRAIVGGSQPAAALRAAVWQSIFTHDQRRYFRSLYNRMADVTTLITGPTGTGKELVARAIGLSRYVAFDPAANAFQANFANAFHPANLSALSANLIESELFGHARGAFTGAQCDRVGYLESCQATGTVFLDEIGELAAAVQVKLLRVLQARTFTRVGESQERRFDGKIIAATNRDLAAEIANGAFRADFYYRLCSDRIHTPSLHQQLADAPEELGVMVRFIAQRLAGDDEADQLTKEVLHWIRVGLPKAYHWPGNFRELEQCVRNVLVRREYHPTIAASAEDPYARLLAAARTGTLSGEDVMRRYCTLVYARSQNYQEAARQLQMDRRTVQRYVDPDLLAQLLQDASSL